MRFPLLLLIATRLLATPVDTANFAETTFLSSASINNPTGLAWAPDGTNRLFITCKGNGNAANNTPAEIRVVQKGVLQSTPFASFNPYGRAADNLTVETPPASDPVFTFAECGLLGLCFDPDFLTNRYVYVFVSVSDTEQQIIRFTDTLSGSDWVGTAKTIIVSGLPTRGSNHNGGGIGIGPDGKLYWSIGDNANNSGADTDLASLAAKVGRADRFTGAAPNDNPFFDGAGPNADRTWARGCRNPFTLTFHPVTGKLWLNVVGSSTTGDTQPRSGPGFEQVFVVERGAHLGWNDYENNQPPGYTTPAIAYGTNVIVTTSLAALGAVRSGGTVTFTTQSAHPLRKGAKVTVAGVADTSFNGTFYVANRLNDAQFTVVQAGADASSGGGTVATQSIGGCVTGGTFYDSTGFPAAHLGNFYFGDVNTGRVMRATLDGSAEVTSVDEFATGISQPVDAIAGPDGALYVARHNAPGIIRRIATTSTAQNVIVYPTGLNVVEGSTAVFTVRLAAAPASNVTVNIAKAGGDADVTGGATLTFTPANWSALQTVTISAAEDADYTNDSATFTVSSSGLPSYTVAVNAIDNDEPRLVISQANANWNEGATTTFTVSLASDPGGTATVSVARASGDSDVNVQSGAALTFTSANYATPQTVTLAAAEDADNSPDTAVISITLAGEPQRTVNASVTDNDPLAPTFTSAPLTLATVNAPYTYDVGASGNPAPGYSFAATPPTGMTINGTTGVITWTPTAAGSYAISVRANNSAGSATQNFTIVVSADAAPLASLTRPLAGDLITGTTAEFFGDGFDDVGCVKAEFLIDGTLQSTDINSGGHYHFNGAHVLFDSTQFTNGPHTLRFRVTDTIGQTGFAEVQVFISNGAAAWTGEKFTAAEQANASTSGDLADPDGDGVKNIFEYLTDTAPKSSTSTRTPQMTTANVSGVDYLAIQFITARWASDVTVTVEAASSPAGPWTSINPDDPTLRVSLATDTPSVGLDTRVVRDSQPLTSGQRFLRLRATR